MRNAHTMSPFPKLKFFWRISSLFRSQILLKMLEVFRICRKFPSLVDGYFYHINVTFRLEIGQKPNLTCLSSFAIPRLVKNGSAISSKFFRPFITNFFSCRDYKTFDSKFFDYGCLSTEDDVLHLHARTIPRNWNSVLCKNKFYTS